MNSAEEPFHEARAARRLLSGLGDYQLVFSISVEGNTPIMRFTDQGDAFPD